MQLDYLGASYERCCQVKKACLLFGPECTRKSSNMLEHAPAYTHVNITLLSPAQLIPYGNTNLSFDEALSVIIHLHS